MQVSELMALSYRGNPFWFCMRTRECLGLGIPSFLGYFMSFYLNQDLFLPFVPLSGSQSIRRKLSFIVRMRLGLWESLTHNFFQYGPCKSAAASHSTILGWGRQTIIQAYGLKDWVPPFPGKSHFTRCMSTSLTFQHQVIFFLDLQGCHLVFCSQILYVLSCRRFCLILCQLWAKRPF